ncbi:ribosome biogenesis protein Nop53/GLTSCR2, partial [Blyttiomyces helicus]
MTPATTTPKLAQPSRKGKKAWRKNVDVGDVEEKLDELRTEERLGGKVHEKKDAALFFTDTTGDEKNPPTKTSNRLPPPTSVKASLKHRKLRIDQILTPASTIPSIASRKTAASSVRLTTGPKLRNVSKAQLAAVERIVKKRKAGDVVVGGGRKKAKKVGGGMVDVWDVK